MPKAKIGDTIFNRYRITDIISREGGQGIVFRGEDIHRRLTVAIKELALGQEGASLNTDDQELINRFRNEAELHLPTPYVVQNYQFGAERGAYYNVMEYVDGASLEAILANEKMLPEGQAIHVIDQICSGLDVAHKHGVIHRDIKPANILVSTQGEVRITDFGIACFLTKQRMTMLGSTLGSPLWSSPEQIIEPRDVDARTDIWSVGVLFYQMVTGQLPFNSKLLADLYMKIVHDPIISPQEINPQLSDQSAYCIMRALERDLEKRYATVSQMQEDLPEEFRAAPLSVPSPTHGYSSTISAEGGSQSPLCVGCGMRNGPGDRFCARCGTALPVSMPALVGPSSRSVCSRCGALLESGARFCPMCGAPMELAQLSARLTVFGGVYMGRTFGIDAPVTEMGREASNRICLLQDAYASRHHARIYSEEGRFYVEGWDWVSQRKTTNGTYLNGLNIDGQGRKLVHPGDTIRIGDTFFRFERQT